MRQKWVTFLVFATFRENRGCRCDVWPPCINVGVSLLICGDQTLKQLSLNQTADAELHPMHSPKGKEVFNT